MAKRVSYPPLFAQRRLRPFRPRPQRSAAGPIMAGHNFMPGPPGNRRGRCQVRRKRVPVRLRRPSPAAAGLLPLRPSFSRCGRPSPAADRSRDRSGNRGSICGRTRSAADSTPELRRGTMTEAAGLDAPITAVTVFRDGARITRSGQVTLSPGLSPVLMPNLPVSADPESVRVAVRGADVALLEVEANLRHGVDPLRAGTVRLRSEAENWRDAVQALDDEDAAEQVGLGFAGYLSEAAANAMARAVSFGRAGHDDLAQMAGFLSSSTASALQRRREISGRRRVAQRELEAAEQRLADAQRPARVAPVRRGRASVETATPTAAQIELSYQVKGAS